MLLQKLGLPNPVLVDLMKNRLKPFAEVTTETIFTSLASFLCGSPFDLNAEFSAIITTDFGKATAPFVRSALRQNKKQNKTESRRKRFIFVKQYSTVCCKDTI